MLGCGARRALLGRARGSRVVRGVVEGAVRAAATARGAARPAAASSAGARQLSSTSGAPPPPPAPAPLVYTDEEISSVLRDVRTVAIVGASSNWKRPSYFAAKYLQQKGYRVIPVNPAEAAKGAEILGERVYASLSDVPGPIDMVDIFRGSDAALGVTREALALAASKGIRVVWMQLGVRNETARAEAEAAGLRVIMDRCPKIEFSRLFGELGWHGFDSGVISSRRARAGAAGPPGGPRFTGLETKAIHSGQRVDDTTGARITPIFQTASYVFEDVEHAASLFNLQTFGNVYSRLGNPTVAALEEKLAALEGGRGATCAASGHAAQLLVLFTLLRPGDRFVASKNLYGGSIAQFRKAGERFGWHCDFVDLEDRAAVRALLEAPRCKLLWAESLANPGGVVSDIEWLSAECKRVRVPLCIDNTLATPALCRPGELGADIVCHSTTKFLSGHGNALGGAVVDIGRFDWSCDKGKYPSLSEPEPAYHGLTFHESFGDLALTTALHAIALRDLGPAMSPFNAFLTSMGVETLPLRMERHVRNALEVAAFLKQHPKVAYVSYAGLKESPFHERMLRLTRGRGAGSVFTFGLKGGFADGVRFVESLHLFSHLANVGDTRSLVLHPGSTTHRQLSEEQRRAAGAGDEVIRLSIGLESAHDLLLDLEQALAKL